MSRYTVTFEDVAAASSGLAAMVEELSGQLRHLSASVEGVLDNSWHGAAATAFEADWQNWRAAATQALASLGALADVVATSGVAYAQTDATVRQAAS